MDQRNTKKEITKGTKLRFMTVAPSLRVSSCETHDDEEQVVDWLCQDNQL